MFKWRCVSNRSLKLDHKLPCQWDTTNGCGVTGGWKQHFHHLLEAAEVLKWGPLPIISGVITPNKMALINEFAWGYNSTSRGYTVTPFITSRRPTFEPTPIRPYRQCPRSVHEQRARRWICEESSGRQTRAQLSTQIPGRVFNTEPGILGMTFFQISMKNLTPLFDTSNQQFLNN